MHGNTTEVFESGGYQVSGGLGENSLVLYLKL